jgi:hypothetical protein
MKKIYNFINGVEMLHLYGTYEQVKIYLTLRLTTTFIAILIFILKMAAGRGGGRRGVRGLEHKNAEASHT